MASYDPAHANIIAYAALLGWLPISVLLFLSVRPFVASAVTLLGAILLLPTRLAFDVPGLPPFSREVIAVLAATMGCLIFAPRSLRFWRPVGLSEICVGILVVAPLCTALSNSDPLQFGPLELPRLTWWDGPSMAFQQLAFVGLPFLLGLRLLRTRRDLRFLFLLLVVAALLYSLPILWEVRMSPQLHRIVYGYHAYGFSTAVRSGGGYRPVVFMSLGIALALFVATATVAATTLTRCRIRVFGFSAAPLAAYLGLILIICKSLAAIIYGIVVVPVVLLTRPRVQLWLAGIVAVLIIAYPLLRTVDLVPTRQMVALATQVDQNRARSLDFRFKQESRLLARARERIVFGWGGWSRNRVFDPIHGRDLSTTDGFWIIQLGILGVAGFVPSFCILLAPIAGALRGFRRIPSRRDQVLVAGLSLIIAFNALDQIPNASLSPFSLFVGGALLSFVRRVRG